MSSTDLDELLKTEINKVEACFKHKRLSDFLLKYETLVSEKNREQHFTYFGINFKDDKVDCVKFYAHLLGNMADDEILQFVPTTNDYLKYVHLKNDEKIISGRDAGVALEIKFKIDEAEPHYGFFYHLRQTEESFNTIGFPSNLPIELKNDCIGIGVNFEYLNKVKLFKHYYYFNKPENKIFFEKKFGLLLLDEVKLIEYAESNSFAKMNAYGHKLFEIHHKSQTFTNNEKAIISYLNKKYKLINLGYGFYENNSTKSIYFFDGESNINPSVSNTASRIFNVFTLNKLVNV